MSVKLLNKITLEMIRLINYCVITFDIPEVVAIHILLLESIDKSLIFEPAKPS